MAIFIAGDTHGDFSKIWPTVFREQHDLTIIVLFGSGADAGQSHVPHQMRYVFCADLMTSLNQVLLRLFRSM